MQFKLDLDIVCTVNLENSSHACQQFIGNMGMNHRQRLVLQLLFSFNQANPLKHRVGTLNFNREHTEEQGWKE